MWNTQAHLCSKPMPNGKLRLSQRTTGFISTSVGWILLVCGMKHACVIAIWSICANTLLLLFAAVVADRTCQIAKFLRTLELERYLTCFRGGTQKMLSTFHRSRGYVRIVWLRYYLEVSTGRRVLQCHSHATCTCMYRLLFVVVATTIGFWFCWRDNVIHVNYYQKSFFRIWARQRKCQINSLKNC